MNSKALSDFKGVFNLNAYEAKIYTSLLSRGISSAGELSDVSGVPRSRCYDVLEGLEKKGFVFQKIGKPIKYIPVPPEEVLDVLKKQAKIEENRLLAMYDSVKNSESFSQLKELYSSGINFVDNNEISHSIVGRQNINVFLKDMLARAENKVIVHTTKNSMSRKLKMLKKYVNKNVEIVLNAPDDPALKSKNINVSKNRRNLRMIITDADEMLLFTSDDNVDAEHEGAVWFKSRFVSDMVLSLLQ